MIYYPPPKILAVVNVIMDAMLILPLKVNCYHFDSTTQKFSVRTEIRNLVSAATYFTENMVVNHKDAITLLINIFINLKVKIRSPGFKRYI